MGSFLARALAAARPTATAPGARTMGAVTPTAPAAGTPALGSASDAFGIPFVETGVERPGAGALAAGAASSMIGMPMAAIAAARSEQANDAFARGKEAIGLGGDAPTAGGFFSGIKAAGERAARGREMDELASALGGLPTTTPGVAPAPAPAPAAPTIARPEETGPFSAVDVGRFTGEGSGVTAGDAPMSLARRDLDVGVRTLSPMDIAARAREPGAGAVPAALQDSFAAEQPEQARRAAEGMFGGDGGFLSEAGDVAAEGAAVKGLATTAVGGGTVGGIRDQTIADTISTPTAEMAGLEGTPSTETVPGVGGAGGAGGVPGLDFGQFGQQQMDLANLLAAQARGEGGPSVAENQARAAMDDAQRQQLALAATSGQGLLGLNQALRSGEQTQRQVVQDLGALRAQEQMTAQENLAALLGQGIGQQLTGRGQDVVTRGQDITAETARQRTVADFLLGRGGLDIQQQHADQGAAAAAQAQANQDDAVLLALLGMVPAMAPLMTPTGSSPAAGPSVPNPNPSAGVP